MHTRILISQAVILFALFMPFGLTGQDVVPRGPTLKMLPEPKRQGHVSVEEAIAKRRSVRAFADIRLTDQELSQLIWAAQGITDRDNGYRAAPSAGATYPLETYLATADGIFHYLPEKHALEPVRKSDARKALAMAALGQRWIETAAAIVIFTTVPERTTRRYGNRGLMYIHMEAGHAAENVHLQAVALGLGSAPIGAFDESAVVKILNLTKTETPLYIIPIGKEAHAAP